MSLPPPNHSLLSYMIHFGTRDFLAIITSLLYYFYHEFTFPIADSH